MSILIPFALLKLRKNLEKERSPENLAAFKKLIMDDIMGNINLNEQLGNITKSDAAKLRNSEKDSEIARLKKQLEQLQNKQ